MFVEAVHAGNAAPRAGDALDTLNAVAFAPTQLEAALGVLALLPPLSRRDPAAQATALQNYAREIGLNRNATVAAALHARIAALAKWTAAHDPDRQSEAQAVIAAASSFPLSDLAGGVGFDAAGFQEMILFIEELPW